MPTRSARSTSTVLRASGEVASRRMGAGGCVAHPAATATEPREALGGGWTLWPRIA